MHNTKKGNNHPNAGVPSRIGWMECSTSNLTGHVKRDIKGNACMLAGGKALIQAKKYMMWL